MISWIMCSIDSQVIFELDHFYFHSDKWNGLIIIHVLAKDGMDTYRGDMRNMFCKEDHISWICMNSKFKLWLWQNIRSKDGFYLMHPLPRDKINIDLSLQTQIA